MPDTAIGLMARYPRIGQVKTRLARSVGDEDALRIYRTLLGETCRLVTGLDGDEFIRTVFVTPISDLAVFKSEYSGFDRLYEQRGSDLGERMQNALGTLLSIAGVSKAMLIGADCPVLTAEHIRNASSLLSSYDLTLGPTSDGGYYLIGLKTVRPGLFCQIKWGTSAVMSGTLSVAQTLRLRVGLLPELRDLDDEQDLEYFDRMKLI